MSNPLILKKLSLGLNYLELLNQVGYTLVDMNMIEPFSVEDKQHHPTNIIFERNSQLFAIRSDWTRTLLNYNQAFASNVRKYGYFGPVVREHDTFYQAGAEIFKADESDIIESLNMHLKFIKNFAEQEITTIVVNNDQLIDKFISKFELDESIKPLIYDKAVSDIEKITGSDHPLYKIMTSTVSRQLELINNIFETTEVMTFINHFKDSAAGGDTKFILDLSFRSPQSYYNGFYFQAFSNYDSPVLSGGEYNSNAFGIGLNLSDGGLL